MRTLSSKYDQIIFVVDNKQVIMHQCSFTSGGKTGYTLCLDWFVNDMINAARDWLGQLDETGTNRVNEMLKPTLNAGQYVIGLPMFT